MTLHAHVSRQTLHVSPFLCNDSVADGSFQFAHKWIAGEIYGWAKLLMASFCTTMAPSRALYCILVFWQRWMEIQGTIETAGFSHSHRKAVSESPSRVFFVVVCFVCVVLLVVSVCLASRRRLMWVAAVQRTLLGGERMAAVWLHDAQIQKHVSHLNYARLQCVQCVWDKDSSVYCSCDRW